MKKASLIVFLILISVQIIGRAEASKIEVTCKPELISELGGKTTITVTSEKGGIGFIKVIQPNDEFSTAVIYIPPEGSSASRDYPDDFISHYTTQNLGIIQKTGLNSPQEVASRTNERLTLLLQSLIEQQGIAQAGSTQLKGKYKVEVYLFDHALSDNFLVKYRAPSESEGINFMVPESPIGTIGSMTALFIALITMIIMHQRVQHA
ncbi:MAG: hypothetical protein JSV27_11515 [Candidatus Bathyarchaeota archaeon]|nr:MAG: hypothetical protein JSV27_11515 [Candidatus Bathyarchaeota archaeon]